MTPCSGVLWVRLHIALSSLASRGNCGSVPTASGASATVPNSRCHASLARSPGPTSAAPTSELGWTMRMKRTWPLLARIKAIVVGAPPVDRIWALSDSSTR